jgi:PAS domain S-box-containing protein
MMSHRKPGAVGHPAAGDPASVLELLEAGIWDWNIATGAIFLSPAWKRQLGYRDDELVDEVRTVDALLHPDDLPKFVEDRRKINDTTGDFFQDECRLRHKDGTYRWMFGRARVVRDDQGRAVRMVGVDTDITERRRVEEALAESEEKAQRAHRLAKTAHWSWHPDKPGGDWRGGTIAFETAADIFGIDGEKLAATNAEYLDRLVYQPDRARVADAFKATMCGTVPRYEVEYRVTVGDGEIKTIYEIGEAIHDSQGRVESVQGTVQDITERARMEDALSQSESRMRRAQQIAKLGHWVIEGPISGGDWSATVPRWSENSAMIFRTTLSALSVTNREYIERFVHPLDREMVVAAYRAAETVNDGEGKPYRLEYRILTADGEVRTIYETAEPTVDARPGYVTWNGVVQDITDRKRMEEALATSEARMRRAQKIAKLGHWVTEHRIGDTYTGTETEHLSAAAAEILGLEPIELALSGNDYIERIVHPADRDMVRAYYTRARMANDGSGSPYRLEFRAIRPDGATMVLNEIAEPSTTIKPGWVVWSGVLQDITERKQMEEALAVSEAQIRRSQQLAKLGHWIAEESVGGNADVTLTTQFSENAAAIFEVTPDELQLEDDAYIERFVHPADRKKVAEKYDEVRKGGGDQGSSYQFEYRIRTPSGAQKFVFEIAEPTPGLRAGNVIWHGVIQDITERKQMEEALSLSESRMRHAQKIAKLGHWVTSRENLRIDWQQGTTEYSESAAAIFGVTPQQLAVSNAEYVRKFVHPADRERAMRVFEAVEHDDTGYRIEYRIVTPQGDVRTIQETALPAEVSESGRVTRQGIVQDITERKQVEETAAQREKLYRSVVESAFDAFVLIDADSKIVEWNPTAEQLFDWPRAEALGKNIMDTIFAPDQREIFRRGIAEYFQTGTASFLGVRNEVQVMQRDGSMLPAELVVWPISFGERVMFSCFIHDMSAQRAMEERLRHVMRMEAVGQLTGGVAHDFNNLLAVILLNAETLAERLDDTPRLKHLAELIGKAADGGKALIEQLSAFARRQILRPRAVHLDDLLVNLLPLLLRSMNESIEVDVELAPDAWPGHVDPNQLENALINLAVNARDAMPEGGKLTIRTENVALEAGNPKLHPGVERGRYLLVSVTDTGVGMRPEVLERAYEPFFTTKDVGKGSGLGLSSVYGFVSQSGGQVKIESAVGKGTTVHLYLPASDDESPVRMSEEVDQRSAEGGSESILVVEDDTLIRDVIEAQLKGLGYDVRAACDGPSAVTILKSEIKIDLVLTDIVMPGGMSGIVVAEKANEFRPGIKVLYASGYPASAFTSAWPDPSKVRILAKPFRTAQLARAVRDALDT